MTGSIDRVEVITSVQRRRRWSAEEKAWIVQETYAPGMSVSLVARQHGSRRARYSNGGSFMPRARCQRSMPAKKLSRPLNTGPGFAASTS